MTKKLLTAAIMAALTLSATSVFAAAPTFSGDTQMLTQKDNGGSTYSDMRLRLNADVDLGEGLYAHGRIMGIDQSGYNLNSDNDNFDRAGTGARGANVNMEQMYVGAKIGATDVKIGRQPLFIGQGLTADVNGIEGISLGANEANFNAFGFIGRSNQPVYPTDVTNTDPYGPRNTVGFNLGTKVDCVNLGIGYLNTKDTTENKYWSFNADTKIASNVKLAAEYVKNNSANANGFLVKATVGELAKKGDFNYAVSYRNIENNAVDSDWTTNGAYANSKGFRLAANYKVTDNSTLYLYKDITEKQNDSTVKPNEMRAEFDINF